MEWGKIFLFSPFGETALRYSYKALAGGGGVGRDDAVSLSYQLHFEVTSLVMHP